MNFFVKLFGFPETSYVETQAALLNIATFTPAPTPHYFRERCDFAVADGRTISAGTFSAPSVSDLRAACAQATCDVRSTKKTTVRNILGEARSLHFDALTARGAVVQAASQFNYLEMPGPATTPEAGISDYVFDRTQGPACAVACAAGTAYRNYLVPVPFRPDAARRGQTAASQLNGLEDAERHFGTATPWVVTNGYVEAADAERLRAFGGTRLDPNGRAELGSRVRIGVQEDADATDPQAGGRRVTQVYCSALAIGYSRWDGELWEPTARVVLEATYEAALLVGTLKTAEALVEGRDPPPVLLTLVGGARLATS
uniref:Uncharacterized protein n=1 Tax=Corethron hystrix TaxID=216773 RepID=A0A7S1BEG7_9STRA|mmetsp:Transcript_22427/g.51380  ORF Transcript_22427/g.51380 Transcript_22427/m.51380 type:complete len:315 (+) Transcript_22427:117-1061(+)